MRTTRRKGLAEPRARGRFGQGAAAAAILWLLQGEACAQFLRLGPFDFTGGAELEGVYTTNVEGERPSEATAEREDYYVITSLSLNSHAAVTPSTDLNVDTGVSVERHARRPDLDNSSNPFGRVRVDSITRLRYLALLADAYVERTSESVEGVYVPGRRKKRDVADRGGYSAALEWRRGALDLMGSYDFSWERHQQREFQDGDKDETTVSFSAAHRLGRRLSAHYTLDQTKTKLINQMGGGGDDSDEWDRTQAIGLSLRVLERPAFTYTFDYRKENEEPWEPTHTFDLSDDVPILETPTVRLTVGAAYTVEDKQEEEDITFTYRARLEHQLSRTARQVLYASREPVETFGSTVETDSSTVGYQFQKDDLFIYNLNLRFAVGYTRDEPKGRGLNPVEKTWSYSTLLEHRRALTRRLERRIAYLYSCEESNLEREVLLEHRVSLNFKYTF